MYFYIKDGMRDSQGLLGTEQGAGPLPLQHSFVSELVILCIIIRGKHLTVLYIRGSGKRQQ